MVRSDTSSRCWKVHHLRHKTVVAIYVFLGDVDSKSVSRNEYFSDEELEFIDTNRIPIHMVTTSQLYMDDTIRTIKLKVIAAIAIEPRHLSIETMYLFCQHTSDSTLAQHIQSLFIRKDHRDIETEDIRSATCI